MKTHIIKIGNSKGIRIPKPVLEQCGLTDEIQMKISDEMLILSPIKKQREGWEKEFEKSTKKKEKDDKVLKEFENSSHEWDDEEWKW